MNKCVAYARQGRPLGICGAIAAQTKGKIYIESYSEPAVVEAINGVRGLLQYTMRLIPIQDMTTVMTVIPKKKPVQKDEWVRMTRGHYKGDLAMVVSVRESGLKCIVQCVPRLDYAALGLSKQDQRIRKKTVRPPQKFFNEQELATLGYAALRTRQRFPGTDQYCDFFDNNYYHEGYLWKEVTVGSMVKPCTEEDPPTLDELQRFRKRNKGDADEDGNENEGSKMAASLLDELSELQGKAGFSKSANFATGGLLVGDKVVVVEGDLVNMKGKVMSIDGTTLKIKPLDTSLDIGGTGEIEFLASQVRKHIAVGVHVKVMDGRYANETGTVVAVEQDDGDKDFTAVVLTDVTNKEISVRTSQVRESSEQYSGQDKLAGYQLYDLVMLSGGGSANEVGIIVRVGREDFTVVNNHGISRDIRPEELRGKRNAASNKAVALDVQGNQIRNGDQVTVAEGPHKGKTGTIKHLSRSQLFLYSQTRTDNAGIFVVRSRSCMLAGSRNQTRGVAAVDGSVSPFATPMSQVRGPAGGGRGKGQDSLIGKTVRIQAGQWKGYLGTVSDATATHVQVELHSRLKKVMVVRERVAVVGDKFGATEEVNHNDMLGGPAGFAGAATPMHGGMGGIGGATPMHGGATPIHDSMSDEVWRPGALDQESTQDETASNEWGAESSNAFSSPKNEDTVWGSTQDSSTWAPSSEKQEQPVSVKREQPGASVEAHVGDRDETAVWFMERVCVQVKSDDKPAVIKEINADKSAIVELEDHTTKTVSFDDVSRILPKEKDMVLVIGGADVGVEGELVCIDGSDAILKDANEDFKIVDYVHLAKIAGDS
jgi:transcription elongation factor SPT5